MFRTNVARAVVLASSIWAFNDTAASVITYEVTSLGGSGWRYDYVLANDSLEVPVEEFTIYFDADLFQNLRSPTGPALWDVLAVEPDPGLPDDGFFDGLAFDLSDALLPGASLDGFSIEFDFLGDGTPGSQFFQFLTATLNVLDTGFTQPAQPSTSVPEPSSLLLFATALAIVALLRLRRRMPT